MLNITSNKISFQSANGSKIQATVTTDLMSDIELHIDKSVYYGLVKKGKEVSFCEKKIEDHFSKFID